jgi:hypothetical protein
MVLFEDVRAALAPSPGATPSEEQLRSLLPPVYYLDIYDDGDVSLFEQLRRMSEDAGRWRNRSLVAEHDAWQQGYEAATFYESDVQAYDRQTTRRPVAKPVKPTNPYRSPGAAP